MAAIPQVEIPDDQAKKVISSQESHFCDLKSINIQPAKLTRTISAFANAEGGELFIGIEDKPRKWSGFSSQEDANAHIQVLDDLFPLNNSYSCEFLANAKQSGLVLKVQINKTREIITASNETAYIRKSAQNLPVKTEDKLQSLRRDKGLSSFETETTSCPLELVTESEPMLKFIAEVVPTTEAETWLKKQLQLIDDKPTVAAVLLFSEEPQAVLPKRCGIKLYRYKTSDDEGTRETLDFIPKSIEGCAYTQIENAVSETTKIIQSVQIRTASGMISASYPTEAIHEIITNAIIHRDYAITEDTHIRIFDNRVEVLSPGKLPGHVTVDNILDERFARNPVTVRLINKFPNPPNKDVGEGLNTAFESMRNVKLKAPVIEQSGGYVKVTLRHEPLATPEESILTYLLSSDEIANRDARAICFIPSENKMKRILQKMVADGFLESVPGRTRYTAAYRLTAKGKKAAKGLK